ncbi:MAG: SH3 domain-containing protein [Chloroflexi bacterium]|nr:SH3 domain-containing protein [Chloroflexota bacterium]
MKYYYFVVLVLLISACTSSNSEIATQSLTPTFQPTRTANPTATPQPQAPAGIVVAPSLNVRDGPGRDFQIIGYINQGNEFYILGEYNDAYDEQWVVILLNNNSFGWVNGESRFITQKLVTVDSKTYNDLLNSVEQARSVYTLRGFFRDYSRPSSLTNQSATSTSSINSPSSDLVPECQDIKENIGLFVNCKIPKAYCSYQPNTNGSPTFCNEAPYPNNNFALIIWGKDWSNYDGHCLIVSGNLSSYQGTLQIEANSLSQISLCD